MQSIKTRIARGRFLLLALLLLCSVALPAAADTVLKKAPTARPSWLCSASCGNGAITTAR